MPIYCDSSVEMDSGDFTSNAVHKGYKIVNGSGDGNGYLWAKYFHYQNGSGAVDLCQMYDYSGALVSIHKDGDNGTYALEYITMMTASGVPSVNVLVSEGSPATRTYTRDGSWGKTLIEIGSGYNYKVSIVKLGGY